MTNIVISFTLYQKIKYRKLDSILSTKNIISLIFIQKKRIGFLNRSILYPIMHLKLYLHLSNKKNLYILNLNPLKIY